MGLLTDIFSKDAGPKVLDYFLSNPYTLIVQYQIETHTKLSYGAVKRVLAELLAKEIVIETRIGRRKAYKLNKESGYIKDLIPTYHLEMHRKEK